MEALQAVRVVRLLKLLRVARAARVFSRWQTKIAIPYSKQARASHRTHPRPAPRRTHSPRARASLATATLSPCPLTTEPPPQSIMLFIVFFIFLCHIMACLWLLVGRMERDLDATNWIDYNLLPLELIGDEWRREDPLAWCARARDDI